MPVFRHERRSTMGSVAHGLRWLRTVRAQAQLAAAGRGQGRALLSYLPAHVGRDVGATPTSHTQHWESAEIARLLAELGFSVDVVHYLNRWHRPKGSYDVLIDVRHNLERWAPLMPGARKILHCDTSHTLSLVTAEHQRLLALQQRRGVTLQPRRYERPNQGIEHADAATVLGNDVTLSTYRFAGTPLHGVPVASAMQWPFDERKDHAAVRARFLWLGSSGMVHKGLDLVLEVFAGNPDLHLDVCGPVDGEQDFVDAYRTELHETPNITTHGFVDVASPVFRRIADRCIGLVYPSSSEGCAGAVVTALHAGLVPVVSRESGVDVPPEAGAVLDSCTHDEIEASVRGLAESDAASLAARSRAAWEHAQATYTRAAFTARYRSVLQAIIDGQERT